MARPPAAPSTVLSRYKLNERQQLVLRQENWANDILYGGAKGGGKSFLIRYIFSLWCSLAPGLLCYLFRRTHEELWKNHMEGPSAFPSMLADQVAARECAIVGKEVRWANGARIFLNHMQLEKHKYKYHGMEMHALGIDEATQFSEGQIRYVFSSVRLGGWRPPDGFQWRHRLPFVLLGANPGGIGHEFIKTRYVDLGPFSVVRRLERGERGTDRQFIPARAEDNPVLMQNDPLYVERLEMLGDEVLVQALREGNWEILAGSMFGTVFRPLRLDKEGDAVEWHVMEARPLPIGWPVWRGMDDGFANPLACYWLSRDPDTGTVYVLDELYSSGLTAAEAWDAIRLRDLRVQFYDHVDRRIVFNTAPLAGSLDSAAFSKTGASEISRGEQMNALGAAFEPVEKWPSSRVARVQNLHRLFRPNPKEQNRKPGIVFFRRCQNAIRSIPKLLRDEVEREDIADGQEDHAFDGVTYGLQFVELRSGRVPLRF
jgi:hypothetical protein